TDRVAGPNRLVGRFGCKPRLVRIDFDEGVKLCVLRGDAVEECGHHIDRRQPPRRDRLRELVRGERGGIGCGSVHGPGIPHGVMPGLVLPCAGHPRIDPLRLRTWMAGTSPATTWKRSR